MGKLRTWATTQDKDWKHKVDWLKCWTIAQSEVDRNSLFQRRFKLDLVFLFSPSRLKASDLSSDWESWPRATSMVTSSYMNMMPRLKWSTLKNYRMLKTTTSGLVSFHSTAHLLVVAGHCCFVGACGCSCWAEWGTSFEVYLMRLTTYFSSSAFVWCWGRHISQYEVH